MLTKHEKTAIKTFLSLLPVLFLYATAISGSFTLGAGTNDCEGSFLFSWEPNTTHNTATSVISGTNADGSQKYRAVVKWDELKDSLYNRTVSSATLSFRYNGTNAATLSMRIKGMLVYWDETEVTWDSALVDPDGVDWNTNGALGAGTDVTTASYDTLGVGDTTASAWYEFDVTTLLQTWDETDTANAQGFLVESYGEDGVYIYLCSDDYATSSLRPQIDVTYTEASAATPQVIIINVD